MEVVEMQANILVYDVGSTYTKAAAFALKDRRFTFLGRGQSPTTLHDVMEGARRAEAAIQAQGVQFAAEMKRYSSCSAAGGLRMVALGYMPRVTAKAAKEVAMTAGARVMQVVSAEEPLSFRREVLMEINPDIILLSGGTDGGDEGCALENAEMICELHGKATVIVACNKYAQRAVAELFDKAGIGYVRVPNIMPTIHELNIKPAREAIHEQFIRQITRARGLVEFRAGLSDQAVVPTPGAVLLASELLAKGTYEQEGAGSLILVDIGGATTDIHSALPELEKLSIEERGLIINNEKQFSYRTVEGNLGLRVSATGIPEAVGPNAVIRAMDGDYGVTPDEALRFAQHLEDHPDYIPADEREKSLERAMATCAINTALRRHAGHYADAADPVMGIMAGTAIGRDLRRVERVLCVGGIFVHSDKQAAEEMVLRCFEDPGISLLPQEKPRIVQDRDYILYAMGVLGKYYPDAAFSFLKEYTGC
ncbi:MAG: glutamate mutase L [Anaerotruncus colihominis]|uniref:glutamate mutase L n=1 Tax=Anaerotruncus colihominis TaxID=169435 RepID=UPI001D48C025|nr:glutamate mutase L [Anaerotruncus colihominis]MBS4988860.1 glutamate mutase L [Anaerotruncus colihominis]